MLRRNSEIEDRCPRPILLGDNRSEAPLASEGERIGEGCVSKRPWDDGMVAVVGRPRYRWGGDIQKNQGPKYL